MPQRLTLRARCSLRQSPLPHHKLPPTTLEPQDGASRHTDGCTLRASCSLRQLPPPPNHTVTPPTLDSPQDASCHGDGRTLRLEPRHRMRSASSAASAASSQLYGESLLGDFSPKCTMVSRSCALHLYRRPSAATSLTTNVLTCGQTSWLLCWTPSV